MINKNNENTNTIYYPPGGILLWIIIVLELLTFGMALATMVYLGKESEAIFHESKLLLNTKVGTFNTMVLLTSGLFMANAVHYFKTKNLTKTSLYLKLVVATGALFCIIKAIEFYQKIDAGYTLDYNMFFTFYWLLTGFHFIHVLVGLIIVVSFIKSIHQKTNEIALDDFEAGATFWHMCDLIWLIVFPVIYLIF